MDVIGAPVSKKAPDAPPPPTAAEKQSAYAQQLVQVPEFTSYGPVINSSTTPAQLTESETEYQVTCVKHIFKEHVVFQVKMYFFDAFYLFTDRNSSSMSRIHCQIRFWNKYLSSCSHNRRNPY